MNGIEAPSRTRTHPVLQFGTYIAAAAVAAPERYSRSPVDNAVRSNSSSRITA